MKGLSKQLGLSICLFTVLPFSTVTKAEQILGCILEPSQKIEVSSAVAGVLETIPVKRGQTVSKGELLFQLRSGVQAAAVKLAKAKAEFAKRNVERNTTLYDDELLSSHERDEIETESLIATLELEAAREELALRKVVSPVNGVIVDRHNDQGEYVTTEPVVELAVLDPLYVEVLMPAANFGLFQVGDKQKLALNKQGDHVYEAVVNIIDPMIDPSSGTFRVRMLLENSDNSIPAGISCRFQGNESSSLE